MSYPESLSFSNLIVGPFPVVTEQGRTLIQQGGTVAAGTVLGLITSTTCSDVNKLTVCSSLNTVGANVPYGVLLDAVDATSAAVANVPMAVTGEFNSSKLILGGEDTLDATMKAALRRISIFTKTCVSAADDVAS